MSDFGGNNPQLPPNTHKWACFGHKWALVSSFGRDQHSFHSRSTTQGRLFEPRKQRGRGGSRFSIAAPGYNGFGVSQNLTIVPIGFAGRILANATFNEGVRVPGDSPGRPQSRVVGWYLSGAGILAAWFGAGFNGLARWFCAATAGGFS